MVQIIEQVSLLPKSQPKGKFKRLPISVFRKMKLIGPPPAKKMLNSVRHFGVIQPIAVVEKDDGYVIGAGIRRVLASIATEQKDVPAMVYDDVGQMQEAIALIENTQRSANPVGEMMAIDSLIAENFSVEQIAKETGMPVVRVRKRLELKQLDPVLYDLLLNKKISMNVAQACVRLPKVHQFELVKTFQSEKQLTMDHVRQVKTKRRDAALKNISASIMSTIPEAPRAIPHETQETIRAWVVSTFGAENGPLRSAQKAAEELAGLIKCLEGGIGDPDEWIGQAANAAIGLYNFAAVIGKDLSRTVDAKMAGFRTRKNEVTGNGNHVSEPPEYSREEFERDRLAGFGDGKVANDKDELLAEAVRLVLESGKASTSLLQRGLNIGYGRAARLIDLMEKDGIVGAPDGPGPRQVLKRPD